MNEVPPEAAEKWLKEHSAQLKNKAERQALNYLAKQQANDLACKVPNPNQCKSREGPRRK